MAAGDPCCVLSPHLILSDPGLVPPRPRTCWIPTATCHLSCRQPCLISCLLSRNALSTWEGHAAPPARTVSAPPETMSPVLTALLRPAALPGGQPLLLAGPCSPKPPSCRRPAEQGPGRGGDSPGRQTAVLTYPRLPAIQPHCPGSRANLSPAPLVHQPPRPETKTDRDECLAPPSFLYTPSLGPSHADVTRTPRHLGPHATLPPGALQPCPSQPPNLLPLLPDPRFPR